MLVSPSPTLARLHDEWNTLPSWIVDPEHHGRECRTDRVFRDRVVVLVTGLVAARGILTEQNVFALDRLDAPEHFYLKDMSDNPDSIIPFRLARLPLKRTLVAPL